MSLSTFSRAPRQSIREAPLPHWPCATVVDDSGATGAPSLDVDIPNYAPAELDKLLGARPDPLASVIACVDGHAVRDVQMAAERGTDPSLAALVRRLSSVRNFAVTGSFSESLPVGPGSLVEAVQENTDLDIDVFTMTNERMGTSVSAALAQSFLPHARVGALHFFTVAQLSKLRYHDDVRDIRLLLQHVSDLSGQSLPLPTSLDEARRLCSLDSFHALLEDATSGQGRSKAAAAWAQASYEMSAPGEPDLVATFQKDSLLADGYVSAKIESILARRKRFQPTTYNTLVLTTDRFDRLEELRVLDLMVDDTMGLAALAKVLERCGPDTVAQLDAPLGGWERGSPGSDTLGVLRVTVSAASVREAVKRGTAVSWSVEPLSTSASAIKMRKHERAKQSLSTWTARRAR